MDLPTDGELVDELKLPKLVSGSEPVELAVEPEEPALETAAAQIGRLQLATHIREPEDDAPRQYDRTTAQTWTLARNRTALVRHVAWDEVEEPILICEKIDKGEAERMEWNLKEGTFRALLADDQSSSRPGHPIGKHRSLVEAEPQT